MLDTSRLSRAAIETVRAGFRRAGIDIHKAKPEGPPSVDAIAQSLAFLRDGSLPEHDFLRFCAPRLKQSHSQLLQDLFVLFETGEKRGGFFVEFGATNGVDLSNTLLLERDFGWRGILAEPARRWHSDLRSHRRCAISTRCVWSRSAESLEFNETPIGELSTIDRFSFSDGHAAERQAGTRYTVETVSLLDLLEEHEAPQTIDYLSIDTEGSELDILCAFDFNRYDIRCISVEHNYQPARERLHALLTRHGYRRRFESLSRWDDWYLRA